MKKHIAAVLCAALCLGLFGCSKQQAGIPTTTGPAPTEPQPPESSYDGTHIFLADEGITVNGETASTDSTQAVYLANDIVYYESGKDFTYGEGSEQDAHTPEEAAAHTVVHITKPGQYVLSGTLTKGQIAIDLGENAKDDPEAVVTLVLEGANITCAVAPAVIFYNVYECGSTDAETASATVDTSAAGANVILADGTVNNIDGAYVAKIYKPESVELNEEGTEVADAKKLHKYDAAFYSRMSMNIDGNGGLNITAANEGLDSELHLTINGGNIHIESGNDGINTNEDYVSVTTINGGSLDILVNGSTGEGDGIDSNGWLVINGGSVTAQACSFSGDAGIDSDMGIHINGGTVFATGNMLDRISESAQNFAVFQFSASQKVSMFTEEFRTYTLKDSAGSTVISGTVQNDFSCLIISCPELVPGDYNLLQGDTLLSGGKGNGMGGGMTPPPGGGNFGGNVHPLNPGGDTPVMLPGTLTDENDNPITINPEDFGDLPVIEINPENSDDLPVIEFNPEDFGDLPVIEITPQGPGGDYFVGGVVTLSTTFTIEEGGNYFVSVQ